MNDFITITLRGGIIHYLRPLDVIDIANSESGYRIIGLSNGTEYVMVDSPENMEKLLAKSPDWEWYAKELVNNIDNVVNAIRQRS